MHPDKRTNKFGACAAGTQARYRGVVLLPSADMHSVLGGQAAVFSPNAHSQLQL